MIDCCTAGAQQQIRAVSRCQLTDWSLIVNVGFDVDQVESWSRRIDSLVQHTGLQCLSGSLVMPPPPEALCFLPVRPPVRACVLACVHSRRRHPVTAYCRISRVLIYCHACMFLFVFFLHDPFRLNRERECADTIGTVPVPWAGLFQC